MSAEIKVLLVEEYEGRAELRKLLAAGQVNVVGEAGFGAEAITVARQLGPEIVVLSMEEPVARPLKTIEGLILSQPNLIILVVSSLGDRDHLRKAMQAGARDYLVKPVRPQEVHKAVLTLYDSEARRQTASGGDAGPTHSGDVISVFGVKGGIGKTSLSVNLAAAIAGLTKQRVGLIDLDLQLGDIAVLLNFLPEHSVLDAADRAHHLEPELLQSLLYQHQSGLNVLPAPPRPEDADLVTADQVHEILRAMSQTYDYVVVDTPPMFSPSVGAVLDQSTLVLLLTSQDLFSIRRTKVALEMLRSWNYSEDKVKLVLNYAYSVNGVASKDVEVSLDYPIFWKVPNDPVVETSVREGQPFVTAHPNAKVAKNVIELARVVSGLKQRQKGLMSRILAR